MDAEQLYNLLYAAVEEEGFDVPDSADDLLSRAAGQIVAAADGEEEE